MVGEKHSCTFSYSVIVEIGSSIMVYVSCIVLDISLFLYIQDDSKVEGKFGRGAIQLDDSDLHRNAMSKMQY